MVKSMRNPIFPWLIEMFQEFYIEKKSKTVLGLEHGTEDFKTKTLSSDIHQFRWYLFLKSNSNQLLSFIVAITY